MSVLDFISKFILFIIPGAISLLLFCYLTGKKGTSEFFSVLLICIASSISFILGNIGIILVNCLFKSSFEQVDVFEVITGSEGIISITGMTSSIISSVLVCILAVFLWDKNYLFKLANWLKLTHMTDNSSVWDYMFDQQPWIVYRDYITGNTYYGCVVKYSDGESGHELLLSDVSVYSKNDGEYHMEQVYLSRQPSEFSIEIDNYEKEKNRDASTAAEIETCQATN